MIYSDKDREDNIIIHLPNKDVGFRVTTWALKQAEKKTASTGVVQLLVKVGIDDGNINLDALCTVAVECFNEYQHFTKGDAKISEREMCEFIDLCGGVLGFLTLLTPGFETYLPKNSDPPQVVGEMISQ